MRRGLGRVGWLLASFAGRVARQGYAPPRVRRATGSNWETGGVGRAFLRMQVMGAWTGRSVYMYVRMGGWACVGVYNGPGDSLNWAIEYAL